MSIWYPIGITLFVILYYGCWIKYMVYTRYDRTGLAAFGSLVLLCMWILYIFLWR